LDRGAVDGGAAAERGLAQASSLLGARQLVPVRVTARGELERVDRREMDVMFVE
jgi:hypothetical protein